MEIQTHPTEMSQGENDYETISEKIGEGAQKTKIFSSACIYRVPKYLRKLEENAYTPRLFAIGPLHRNEAHLQTPMKHVKMSYTDNLVCRLTVGMTGPEKKKAVLQECIAEMKKSINVAKKWYAEDVTLNEEMLLVDGCFILEFLYRSRLLCLDDIAEKKVQETDPIFGNIMTVCTLENDLVLLENQIPFFVLEKLFQLTVGRIQDRPDKNWSLTDYVWGCYWKKMSRVGNSTNAKTSSLPRDCVLWVYGNKQDDPKTGKKEALSAGYYHILHYLHDLYVPHDRTEPGAIEEMPSASELYFAGVKFVPGLDAGDSLFKFKFKFSEPKGLWWWCCRARFVIPPLQLNDDTELYLRNLIAFEQYCPGVSQSVTSYALVMDMLVNSDKDVEGLEKAKVIRNCLGARKDATDLFNKLCKETALGDREFVFAQTCIKATRYSKCFWPKNMLHLRRTYFASPWTFIAFIIGFMAFVISLVEFVRSFLKKE